jgi:hypothetical protein
VPLGTTIKKLLYRHLPALIGRMSRFFCFLDPQLTHTRLDTIHAGASRRVEVDIFIFIFEQESRSDILMGRKQYGN